MSNNYKGLNQVRVWDLPTRLFHWALVICVVGLAITGTIGGNAVILETPADRSQTSGKPHVH